MISNVKQNNKLHVNVFAVIAIVLYIVSAIAFECTPETAKVATLGIYLVFIVGILYIIWLNNIVANTYDASLLFMTLWALIMVLPMNGNANSMNTLYLVLTCSVLCFMVKFIVYKNTNIVKWILWASIIGSLILAIRIIIIYGGISAMFEYASGNGEHRVGEITNENTIGLFMANAALCCFSLLFYSKSKIKKILLIFLSVIFIVMLLLSGSKKSIVFMLFGGVAILIYNTRKLKTGKKVLWAITILAFVFIIIYAINNFAAFGTIKIRLEELFDAIWGGENASQTDQVRFDMMQEGLQAFLQSPLFGNGTGYSYELFDTYSHNNFIEILMNYGLVGFLIYYLPYLFLIPKLWRIARNKDIYAIYFLVYIILQILLSIGWVNYYERIPQLVTAAAWGYVSAKSLKGGKNEVK